MNRHVILLAAAGLLVASLTAVPVVYAQRPVDDEARVVNGLGTVGEPAVGALLFVGPDAKNQFLDCSGVLIGCRTVITAAHCICKTADNADECIAEVEREFPETADLRIFFQHAGIFHVRGIQIAPDYLPGVRSDLALLRLSEKVTGIHPLDINKQESPDAGTTGTIVGFGGVNDTERFEAIKRFGTIEVGDCPAPILSPANICWRYDQEVGIPGADSNTCPGDDGGPLLVDSDKGLVVAGIHAGNRPNCEPGSTGFDTNVFKNRAWIEAAGGADLDNEICDAVPFGGLSHVGDDRVIVQGAEAKLARPDRQARFSFPVPSRTRVLRVTVNGDNRAKGDYDLFVAFGRDPVKGDNDCEVRARGQFGVCIFDEPEQGEVNVLVQHVMRNEGSGNSFFQVTVTAFRFPPEGDPPSPPERLRATLRTDELVSLAWEDTSDDEEGFLLQRKLGNEINEFFDHAVVPPNTTRFLDRIEPELIFTYRVRAFNDAGASRFSNECIVNEDAPARPLGLRATLVSPTRVELLWRDRSNNETGFLIERRKKGQNQFEALAITDQNERTFVDRSVQPQTVYEYRVQARGKPGECVPNSRFSRVREVDTAIPVP